MSLVVMQLVLQSEEPRRAALCSTRGELYRASKIHAMVLPQVEQVVYQGRGGLLSPVSQQQSLLWCSVAVTARAVLSATWMPRALFVGLKYSACLSGWGPECRES